MQCDALLLVITAMLVEQPPDKLEVVSYEFDARNPTCSISYKPVV
uniref:Uncharacterized protein n=1 Tax=Acrobeloides nanus TaxID=290746 RepID=A0A914DMF9_9BILA